MWALVSLGEGTSGCGSVQFAKDAPLDGLCISFGLWLLVLLLAVDLLVSSAELSYSS